MNTKRVDIEFINKNIVSDHKQYILECEKNYKNQIYEATNNIIKKGGVKFVMLAGPSSSGKTTPSKILVEKLEENGLKALPISLDDFFVERIDTPKWEDGSYNYESVDAIDWRLFSKCMEELLEGKPCFLPTYNFADGKKYFSNATSMHENTIVIIEGLHALNPVIDNFIPTTESYKIYISVNSSL
ncbi:MAG: nucleoside kinase, partial [Clostridia bacterium]|nr:nucleoside kinase [Clostridia bacterium]